MKKVCIRGNKENPERVIRFLESLGGLNRYLECDVDYNFYYIDDDLNIDFSPLNITEYTEISFKDACAILDGKAVLNDDCTVTYKNELPEFPCMMWVWCKDVDYAVRVSIHGYIPTLKYPWIDFEGEIWLNASLTEPLIKEKITIEEAEKLLGKKIRR